MHFKLNYWWIQHLCTLHTHLLKEYAANLIMPSKSYFLLN